MKKIFTNTPLFGSVSHIPSSRRVSVRDIGRFFMLRTTTLRGDERGVNGFTLIELLVVVLIIGILSAVALPQYQKAVEKARMTEGIMAVEQIARLQELYRMANGNYTRDINDLDLSLSAEDTTYDGYPAKKGKYFIFVATNSSGTQYFKALAKRFKGNNIDIYVLSITLSGDRVCIIYSGSDYEANLCKEWADSYTDYRS